MRSSASRRSSVTTPCSVCATTAMRPWTASMLRGPGAVRIRAIVFPEPSSTTTTWLSRSAVTNATAVPPRRPASAGGSSASASDAAAEPVEELAAVHDLSTPARRVEVRGTSEHMQRRISCMDLLDRSRRSLGTGCAPLATSAPACAARSEGSVSDLEALFRTHWPRAYRAAYLVTHDAAAAEDIAQESFLAALRALDRFDRRRPFGPWLHRIVVNRAIDWTRARRLRAEVELADSVRRASGARRAGRRRPGRARPPAARASGGRRDALPARVHAGRDRGGARPSARHRQLATAPRARRAGGRAVKRELERVDIPSRARRPRTCLGRRRRGVRRAHARAATRRTGRALPPSRWPSSALVAATLSSPGRAVLDEIREVVGVERAQPALFSLPVSGRLLVSLRCRRLGGLRGRLATAARRLPRSDVVAVRPLRRRHPRERARGARAGRRRPLDARPAGRQVSTLGRNRDRHAHRVRRPHGNPRRRRRRHGRSPARSQDARGPLAWRPGQPVQLAVASARDVRVLDVAAGPNDIWRARALGAVADRMPSSWSADGDARFSSRTRRRFACSTRSGMSPSRSALPLAPCALQRSRRMATPSHT